MVRGLPTFASDAARRRSPNPKLQAMNTALMTAISGLSPEEARADRESLGAPQGSPR